MSDANDIVIDDYAVEVEAPTTREKVEKRVSALFSEGKDQVARGTETVVKAAKDNPKAAIAAGAAVVVGAIAAVAIPAIRAATKAKPRTSTAAKRTTARKPAATKAAAKKTTTRKSPAKSGTPAHA